jgi:hypothetical protein
LEPKKEVCLFVVYPKGTRGQLFYNPEDRKVFAITNAKFLEDNYMNNYKSKNRVVLELMSDARAGTSPDIFGDEMIVSNTPHVTINEIPSTIIAHCSGGIVRVPNIFMFLGELMKLSWKNLSQIPRSKMRWLMMWMHTNGSKLEIELESMYSNKF